ncbi:hypothetical protein GDO81_018947 [Engystomops pustulosus]|uniref:Cytochrome b n=1 Tax=Engystomops pustulosus TaxID=76066 RepID=A0AAV6YZY7_ENGPU|nr:hypothetical protein GDO81_018947 [Engystomops pustulosus]
MVLYYHIPLNLVPPLFCMISNWTIKNLHTIRGKINSNYDPLGFPILKSNYNSQHVPPSMLHLSPTTPDTSCISPHIAGERNAILFNYRFAPDI